MTATQEIIASKTRKQWADVINGDWRKSTEGIIQTGDDLVRAKTDLPTGQFGEMIRHDLDFSYRMAKNLMEISQHPRIANVNRGSHLPRAWTVLRELARLKPEDFDWAREHNLVSEKMSRGAATAIRKARNEPGEGVVSGGQQRDLPKPSEARDIARETGRFVAASDGRIYSGASEEEGAEATRITRQTYGTIDAINLLANLPEPNVWMSEAPHFQMGNLTPENVEKATAWLMDLATAMEADDGG